MTFDAFDLVTIAARQRQHRLLRRSAEFRVVRRADLPPPSFWRPTRPDGRRRAL